MPLSPGDRLGPYEIVAPLGAGGMGEVYRARDTRLERIVAIKVLASVLATDPQFRERFAREARSISALNHPNICALHDIGEASAGGPASGSPFLVMEYLDGEPLTARLARSAVPVAEALAIPDCDDRLVRQLHLERRTSRRPCMTGALIAALVLFFIVALPAVVSPQRTIVDGESEKTRPWAARP